MPGQVDAALAEAPPHAALRGVGGHPPPPLGRAERAGGRAAVGGPRAARLRGPLRARGRRRGGRRAVRRGRWAPNPRPARSAQSEPPNRSRRDRPESAPCSRIRTLGHAGTGRRHHRRRRRASGAPSCSRRSTAASSSGFASTSARLVAPPTTTGPNVTTGPNTTTGPALSLTSPIKPRRWRRPRSTCSLAS